MSLPSAVIDALVAAGCSAEQLAAAMKAANAEAEARQAEKREKDAARQRKSRLSRSVTVTPCDTVDSETAAPNDIYSNPPVLPSGAKAPPPPFELKLVSSWNAGPAANGARKAAKLNASRKNLLKARLRENTEDEILGAMANLAASKFHCGENDRGWRVDLGWFLKAENFLKALEMAPAPSKAANDPRFATEEGRKAYLAELEAKPKPWMQSDRLKADMPPGKPITFASLTAGRQ